MNPRQIAELVVKWRRRADEYEALAARPGADAMQANALRNSAMHIGRCAHELEEAASWAEAVSS